MSRVLELTADQLRALRQELLERTGSTYAALGTAPRGTTSSATSGGSGRPSAPTTTFWATTGTPPRTGDRPDLLAAREEFAGEVATRLGYRFGGVHRQPSTRTLYTGGGMKVVGRGRHPGLERAKDNPGFRGTTPGFEGVAARRLVWPADDRPAGASLHAKAVVVDGAASGDRTPCRPWAPSPPPRRRPPPTSRGTVPPRPLRRRVRTAPGHGARRPRRTRGWKATGERVGIAGRQVEDVQPGDVGLGDRPVTL